MTKTAETLQITTPNDLELVMTRVFDAPAQMVFDAWTKPELVQRWYGVWGGRTMPVCEIDLRVGGSYRFVWRSADGDTGVSGTYRDVAAPERLVHTEHFDYAWYPGDALITMTLREEDGRTTVTTTTRFESQEARDTVMQSQRGTAKNYELLDQVLASLG